MAEQESNRLKGNIKSFQFEEIIQTLSSFFVWRREMNLMVLWFDGFVSGMALGLEFFVEAITMLFLQLSISRMMIKQVYAPSYRF